MAPFDVGDLSRLPASLKWPPKTYEQAPPPKPKASRVASLALNSLMHLPTPVVVLGTAKTVVLANDAMKQLLKLEETGIEEENEENLDVYFDPTSMSGETDGLTGQTLMALGIVLICDDQRQDANPEDFLDMVAERSEPPRRPADKRRCRSPRQRHLARESVIDVEINAAPAKAARKSISIDDEAAENQVKAKMTVSCWILEGERYFTCTFVRSELGPLQDSHDPSKDVHGEASRAKSATPHSSHSPSSLPSLDKSPSSRAFRPPHPAPGAFDAGASPQNLEEIARIKDAMIDAVPLLAVWKDETFAMPNTAMAKLLQIPRGAKLHDYNTLLSRFDMYCDEFKRILERDESPMTRLCRDQTPFTHWKVGLKFANGTTGNFDVSGDGIYDETTGEFLAGILAFKDVTRYKNMIKAQNKQNEQQFQLVCDSLPQLLWTTDPQGRHDWFSHRWYEYTGQSREDSLGEGWQHSFHEDDLVTAKKRWKHSLDSGDEYSVEYRCRRHDGMMRFMLGLAVPLREQKTGKILKWFGSCTDIEDLVRARQAAKSTRESLLSVIEHAHLTVWTVDQDRNFTFLEGKLMWDPDEKDVNPDVVGQNVYEVFGRQKGAVDLHIYREPIEKILEGNFDESYREHHIDGNNRWFRTRFLPIHHGEGPKASQGLSVTGVIGISMDVTEIKQREKEIQSSEAENMRLLSAETAATEASRLKSQFLANMSHEIRTPIAGVIGMSELLLDTSLDGEQKDFAENIHRSANGLLTVINDILDLSKVESGRLDVEEVQFSLTVVLQDVCKMLSFAAERKDIAFKTDINLDRENDLIVMGDPGRVRQILTNLLTNSIKFTTHGYVKLAVLPLEETNTTVNVTFVISDTGIGIEEELQKKLFKPFSQADTSTARRFGGTGLGLTICKHLVELMQGSIKLESELDKGTKATFSVRFNKPQYTESSPKMVELESLSDRLRCDMSVSGCTSESNRKKSAHKQDLETSTTSLVNARDKSTKQEAPQTKKNQDHTEVPENYEARKDTQVMVVEDNAINQQIALRTVQKLGFSCFAVWNGQEALDYLKEEPSEDHPMPNIILMDCQMPVLDGLACTDMIRNHDPYINIVHLEKIPIVAMTASAIQGDEEKCRKAGMDDYLAKPVKGKTLERMLVKWAFEKRGVATSGSLTVAKDAKDSAQIGKAVTSSKPDVSRDDNSSPATKQVSDEKPSNSQETDWHNPEPLTSISANLTSGAHASFQESYISSTPDNASINTPRNAATAEEKAISLRNDKLFAAADGVDARPRLTSRASGSSAVGLPRADDPSSPLSAAGGGGAALTHANVGLFNRGQQPTASDQNAAANDLSGDLFSLGSAVATGVDSSEHEYERDPESQGDESAAREKSSEGPGQQSSSRAVRSRNEGLARHDSELTITKESQP